MKFIRAPHISLFCKGFTILYFDWSLFIKTNMKVRLLMTFSADLNFHTETDARRCWFLKHIPFGSMRTANVLNLQMICSRHSLTRVWEGCALGEKDFTARFFSLMDVNMTEDIFVR